MVSPRAIVVLVAVLLSTPAAPAQGIRGVTRRTSTLEFQAPARQFFDAAGMNVAGGGAPGTAGSPATAVPARPVAMPMLANKPAPRTIQARPYVLGPAPIQAGRGTNAPAVAARP